RGGVGSSQSGVCGIPDTCHATAGADEQRGRRQAYESQEQRVFDQVLALLVLNKVLKQRFHHGFSSFLIRYLSMPSKPILNLVISACKSEASRSTRPSNFS